jgi:hypothetical protein
MRYELNNGTYVGSAQWLGPGRVSVDVEDPGEREFFERYFSAEDSFLTGPVESAEMTSERRNESEEAFRRAAFRLAAYAYRVTRNDMTTGAT